jgi:hypothetical protein
MANVRSSAFYANFLQRSPDPASEQAAVAALQGGRLSPEALGELFLSSDEYYTSGTSRRCLLG